MAIEIGEALDLHITLRVLLNRIAFAPVASAMDASLTMRVAGMLDRYLSWRLSAYEDY